MTTLAVYGASSFVSPQHSIHFRLPRWRRPIIKMRPVGMVESRIGAVAWGLWPTPRFPSPLVDTDMPISGIRLSDWLHREAHDDAVNGRRSRRSRRAAEEGDELAPSHDGPPVTAP